ncbi:MAG: nucleoside triphosphate pyrophosphohydrolase family protein [Pseudomonadota bacterium]
MKIDDYATWATSIKRPYGNDSKEVDLAYLGLGLAGESGEVTEVIKKYLRSGTWDGEHLAEELGDVIYYWSKLCLAAGVRPSEILERSKTKIEGREAKNPA